MIDIITSILLIILLIIAIATTIYINISIKKERRESEMINKEMLNKIRRCKTKEEK